MYEPKLDVNSALQGYLGLDPYQAKALEGYSAPVVIPDKQEPQRTN